MPVPFSLHPTCHPPPAPTSPLTPASRGLAAGQQEQLPRGPGVAGVGSRSCPPGREQDWSTGCLARGPLGSFPGTEAAPLQTLVPLEPQQPCEAGEAVRGQLPAP